MVNFGSDNVAGVAPEILQALAQVNDGQAMPYGRDPASEGLTQRFQEVFETDCAVFPVATGTAGNVLGLSVLTPPFGAIYCHGESHINVDECGAPEFYSGGAKLVALPGNNGKISAEGLASAITGAGDIHHVQPAAVSLSQVSEAGTVYSLEEIRAIAEVARGHDLGLQMDGARFANAVVALGCSPAEMTWKAGVDVLTFGATKNGAMAAEAVLVFKPGLARELAFRRKRGGHLFSKMRFLSAQLEAYLAGDLWLRHAAHANGLAQRLAAGLTALPGVSLRFPVQANELFPCLPAKLRAGLRAEGFQFYDWGPEEDGVRLIMAFNSRPEDVAAFLAAAARLAG